MGKIPILLQDTHTSSRRIRSISPRHPHNTLKSPSTKAHSQSDTEQPISSREEGSLVKLSIWRRLQTCDTVLKLGVPKSMGSKGLMGSLSCEKDFN